MNIENSLKPPSRGELAKKLGISRSTLYYKSRKTASDELTRIQIDKVMSSNRAYGHKRVAMDLKINKKKVLRIMKKFGLKPLIMRGKKWSKPGDKNLPAVIFRNEIICLCPLYPNVAWSGDFTYIKYHGSFIFLATVMDIFTREIVGAAISCYHNCHLVKAATLEAKQKRGLLPQYFHSDQGSEYRAEENADYLLKEGVIVSMSKKAHPWENGCQESFYSQFKLELGNVNRFDSQEHLIEAIWLQLYYYNSHRIHTALKMSPKQYYALNANSRS
jgi:transposase InsO family protein